MLRLPYLIRTLTTCIVHCFNLTATLSGRYYHSHFAREETEALKGCLVTGRVIQTLALHFGSTPLCLSVGRLLNLTETQLHSL